MAFNKGIFKDHDEVWVEEGAERQYLNINIVNV
jgi:hypothetical protein